MNEVVDVAEHRDLLYNTKYFTYTKHGSN
jgi:hypothetical protein